jgi:2-amino-4-hydroxy-6-hydroxymethyldihydropteridine diphosphokinase|tara:strand:+ start:3352 stop:3825 length:474 start_codon:yes stop_codon:yes gene_type:complete
LLAYIGLGSNLKGPKAQIKRALAALNDNNGTELMTASSLYESKPLLDIPGPNYINAVCKIETKLSAIDLLDLCQEIEESQQRVREVKWDSRTIDLDILLYGEQVISNKRLTIPHPEAINRAFVLVPLFEIDPTVKIPLLGPIKTLLNRINKSDVKKL